MTTKPKRPRDANQLAKLIADIATGDAADPVITKNMLKVESGRKGGERGGKGRMDALTEEQRRELATKAAQARWNKTAPPRRRGPTTATS